MSGAEYASVSMSNGHLLTGDLFNDSDRARFWSHVDHSGGPSSCWFWSASTALSGHGQFKCRGRSYGAHRVALALSGTDIAAGLVVRHTCDVRRCCNPSHLQTGTVQDNNQDTRTRCPHIVLTETIVCDARRRVAAGESYTSLALEYGVKPGTLRAAINGTSWAHIVDPAPLTTAHPTGGEAR